MSGLVVAFGLGFGLGVVTGMPLAIVNVAILDAATAGRRRFAQGLGLGGGMADTVHAMLGFAGVGRIVTANPSLVRGLAIGAAVVIVAYTALAWRRRRGPSPGEAAPVGDAIDKRSEAPPQRGGDKAPRGIDRIGRGVAAGAMLTVANPAALGAWVAAAASLWPGATLLEAGVIAGGVGLGSALWFTLLARWISRLHARNPDRPVLRWIPRIALALFLVIAAVGVVRAL